MRARTGRSLPDVVDLIWSLYLSRCIVIKKKESDGLLPNAHRCGGGLLPLSLYGYAAS
jgi:hypothetical protein